ncbi:MAG: hypothetical protein HZC36_06905 [Armatimonadetes bacterium]|nr:hypothetical protein [Armatimonadota bacterium]
MEESEFHALIEGLKCSQTAKRRSAAIKLRKVGLPEAGPALLDALEAEIRKKVTWETQYQLLRALGECDYRPALSRILEIASDPERKTLELSAAGMSIVRLARKDDNDPEPILAILRSNYHWLVKSGATCATAMLKMRFTEEIAASILSIAPNRDEGDWYFLAIACAGWSGPAVGRFLETCEQSRLGFVREAALLARAGKYKRISIL